MIIGSSLGIYKALQNMRTLELEIYKDKELVYHDFRERMLTPAELNEEIYFYIGRLKNGLR